MDLATSAGLQTADIDGKPDLGGRFIATIHQIAVEHEPARAPFFIRLREARGSVVQAPELLGQIHLVYQAAMHAIHAAAETLPHLPPQVGAGGQESLDQLTRLFRDMGAALRVDDDLFRSPSRLCSHLDPDTEKFLRLTATLYARSLGPWCVMEVMSGNWSRALIGALGVHMPGRMIAWSEAEDARERRAARALAMTAEVLRRRPELYSETILDARLMAEALDRVWQRLDTIVRLAEQRSLLQRDAWDPEPEQPDLELEDLLDLD